MTDDGKLRIRHRGKVVAEIPNPALADEAPRYDRPHNTKPFRKAPLDPPAPIPTSKDLNADLLRLVGSSDLCSKRWIWEQYDYTVRTNTIAGPGSDAAVVRVKETDTSIAMSLDGNGRYCYLDPREGAKLAVAECCRNLATTGAVPVAATNNLNFGNPERPEIMAQLVEAIEGIAEACEFFEAPITGGNVSLYNETLGEGIYPTPVLGIIGLMKTAIPAPIQFRSEGAEILLLGGFGETDEVRFGSSEYAKVVLNHLWGLPPRLDMDYEKRVHDAVREILAASLADITIAMGKITEACPLGLAPSASTTAMLALGDALAVALSECCTPGLGANVTIGGAIRPEFALFGESPSRVLVTTRNSGRVREIALFYRVECPVIGVTMKERLRIGNQNSMWIDILASDLKQSFENGLPRLLSQPLTNAG